jgi:hypothetical protein
MSEQQYELNYINHPLLTKDVLHLIYLHREY